jgi:hypothetical protein
MSTRSVTLASGFPAALAAAIVLANCGGGDDPTCDELAARATDTRAQAQQNASLMCSTADDCVLDRYPLRCRDDCGFTMLLARSDVPAVESATRTANDTHCRAFEQKECVVISPPCVNDLIVRTPVCRNGQCAVDITQPD